MATQRPKTETLYLDQVTLQGVLNRDHMLRLFIENEELELQTRDNRTWTPTKRPGVSPRSVLRAEIRMSGKFLWAKKRQTRGVINLQALFNDYWSSDENEVTVPKDIILDGKHHQYQWILEFRFSASTTKEVLREFLRQLEKWLIGYSPTMTRSTEKLLEMSLLCGLGFAALNPISLAVFLLATATFELLKLKNRINGITFDLVDRLEALLPLADMIAEKIVCNEMSYVGRVISQIFEVMHMVAISSWDYVKHSRMEFGLAYLKAIKGMDVELTKVAEELMYAVELEALRFAKRSHSSLRVSSGQVWEGQLRPQTPTNILGLLEGV